MTHWISRIEANKKPPPNPTKTRIELRWNLSALGWVLCLQEKRRWRWKTLSWIYPDIMKDNSCKAIKEWLWWKYNKVKEPKKSDKQIGKELMSKCSLEWNQK